MYIPYLHLILIGCTPCVNDLYQEEMSEWLKLKSMTVCERRQWWQEKEKQQNISTDVSLSQETFRQFSHAL